MRYSVSPGLCTFITLSPVHFVHFPCTHPVPHKKSCFFFYREIPAEKTVKRLPDGRKIECVSAVLPPTAGAVLTVQTGNDSKDRYMILSSPVQEWTCVLPAGTAKQTVFFHTGATEGLRAQSGAVALVPDAGKGFPESGRTPDFGPLFAWGRESGLFCREPAPLSRQNLSSRA